MSDIDDAWQSALAAEHQAVFGYGLLGPHLAGAQRSLARAYQQAHETLRDDTATALSAAGKAPVVPQADYPTLYPVPNAKTAVQVATRLETAAAAAWRYLYAEVADVGGDAALRARAQQALAASAVRATRWRIVAGDATPTVAFPGI